MYPDFLQDAIRVCQKNGCKLGKTGGLEYEEYVEYVAPVQFELMAEYAQKLLWPENILFVEWCISQRRAAIGYLGYDDVLCRPLHDLHRHIMRKKELENQVAPKLLQADNAAVGVSTEWSDKTYSKTDIGRMAFSHAGYNDDGSYRDVVDKAGIKNGSSVIKQESRNKFRYSKIWMNLLRPNKTEKELSKNL